MSEMQKQSKNVSQIARETDQIDLLPLLRSFEKSQLLKENPEVEILCIVCEVFYCCHGDLSCRLSGSKGCWTQRSGKYPAVKAGRPQNMGGVTIPLLSEHRYECQARGGHATACVTEAAPPDKSDVYGLWDSTILGSCVILHKKMIMSRKTAHLASVHMYSWCPAKFIHHRVFSNVVCV